MEASQHIPEGVCRQRLLCLSYCMSIQWHACTGNGGIEKLTTGTHQGSAIEMITLYILV